MVQQVFFFSAELDFTDVILFRKRFQRNDKIDTPTADIPALPFLCYYFQAYKSS